MDPPRIADLEAEELLRDIGANESVTVVRLHADRLCAARNRYKCHLLEICGINVGWTTLETLVPGGSWLPLHDFSGKIKHDLGVLRRLLFANLPSGVDGDDFLLRDSPEPADLTFSPSRKFEENKARIGFARARNVYERMQKLIDAGHDPRNLSQDYYSRVETHIQEIDKLIRWKLTLFAERNLQPDTTARGDVGAKSRKKGRKRQSSLAEARKVEEAEESTTTFNSWDDIGIGVDEDWSIRVFQPPPSEGDAVRLADTPRLELPGKRWPVVLECFAESKDGRSASKAELMTGLGYCQRPQRDEHGEFDLKDATIIKTAASLLRDAMADLGRDLRRRLAGPKDTVFRSDEKFYRSAVTVRFLIRKDGKIYFSSKP